MTRASVVVRSRNEAPRLRLTLASLAVQTTPAEVVVVNDGSTDATREVMVEAAGRLQIVAIHHTSAKGRAASSNEGVQASSGDIVIFLDGDTLAGPDLVASHLAAHAGSSARVVRGETLHLRSVRLFLDPETAVAMPGEEARVAALRPDEIKSLRLTREQVESDFGEVERRAQIGIYPGAGPRRLQELHMEALSSYPDCPVLWEAAAGSNMSVSRQALLAVGGMNNGVEINAHREVALRLMRAGLKMTSETGARSYHLTHRRGWRDPLVETAWESAFYAAHPIAEVALLAVFWGSIADRPAIPEAARIHNLPALAHAAERVRGVDGIGAVRAAHLEACGVGALAA